jgi:DNA-binding NtrC family response regulator
MEMPGMDGMAILSRIKDIAPWTPVIVVSASDDVPTAVRAIRLGAADFLSKPLNMAAVIDKIRTIISRRDFENSGTPLKLREKSPQAYS